MTTRIAILFLIALFNVACLCSTGSGLTEEEVTQTHAPVNKQTNILIIGDSISRGYFMPVQESLDGKAEVTRSSTGLIPDEPEQWDALLGEMKWDVITFNWGLHELKQGTPEELKKRTTDYLKRLETAIVHLKKTNAKLIFVTTTPVPEPNKHKRLNTYVLSYNKGATALMREHAIAVCDQYAIIEPVHEKHEIPSDKPGLRDVHFKASGSAIMGDALAKAIVNELSDKE